VLGLVAERLGLEEDARAAYARIRRPTSATIAENNSFALVRRRLAALGAR
jgi:hypothetical protein